MALEVGLYIIGSYDNWNISFDNETMKRTNAIVAIYCNEYVSISNSIKSRLDKGFLELNIWSVYIIMGKDGWLMWKKIF